MSPLRLPRVRRTKPVSATPAMKASVPEDRNRVVASKDRNYGEPASPSENTASSLLPTKYLK